MSGTLDLGQSPFQLERMRGKTWAIAVAKESFNHGAYLPVPSDFRDSERKYKDQIIAWAEGVINSKDHYLPNFVAVKFFYPSYPGTLSDLEIALFGPVNTRLLAAQHQRFKALKNIEIDISIHNEVNAALSDSAAPALQPTLSIFYDKTDFAMSKLRNPEAFMEDLAKQVTEDYQELVNELRRGAQFLLLPNEF